MITSACVVVLLSPSRNRFFCRPVPATVSSVVHSGSRSTAGTPQASSLKGSKISFPIARLWACGLVGYGYHLSSPYPPNPILISSSAAQISLTPYPASLHHHRTAPSPAAHLSRRCATSAATAAASALQAADTPPRPSPRCTFTTAFRIRAQHLHRCCCPRTSQPPSLPPWAVAQCDTRHTMQREYC